MAEQEQPSGATLRQSEMVDAQLLELLEKRLAGLEARLESDGLGWESDYRKKLLREVDQRIEMRQTTVLVAGVVLAVMVVFAWLGLSVIDGSAASVYAGSSGALKVGLFVAPIISITAITVMLLIGAFKKPKDDDEVNLPNLIGEAIKALRG